MHAMHFVSHEIRMTKSFLILGLACGLAITGCDMPTAALSEQEQKDAKAFGHDMAFEYTQTSVDIIKKVGGTEAILKKAIAHFTINYYKYVDKATPEQEKASSELAYTTALTELKSTGLAN
jgi:hypothetical protein